MDDWGDPRQAYRWRKSLYREQYNALGKRNLAAIERIVTAKISARPGVRSPVPVCGRSAIRHHRKWEVRMLLNSCVLRAAAMPRRQWSRSGRWKKCSEESVHGSKEGRGEVQERLHGGVEMPREAREERTELRTRAPAKNSGLAVCRAVNWMAARWSRMYINSGQSPVTQRRSRSISATSILVRSIC
jgi:hypothetical protein